MRGGYSIFSPSAEFGAQSQNFKTQLGLYVPRPTRPTLWVYNKATQKDMQVPSSPRGLGVTKLMLIVALALNERSHSAVLTIRHH